MSEQKKNFFRKEFNLFLQFFLCFKQFPRFKFFKEIISNFKANFQVWCSFDEADLQFSTVFNFVFKKFLNRSF